MIIINFKNYTSGERTLRLAKKIEKFLPKAIIAVPAVDIEEVASETKLKVFAQHIDAIGGRATGFLLPETTKAVGAQGTILNHSEHPLPYRILKKAVPRAHKAGLRVILCAPTLKDAKKLMKLKPEAIALEDKKLIGTKKSITQYRTEEIKKFAHLLNDSPHGSAPLCGAGIHSAEDVKASHALGCFGVLIASAVAKAPSKKAEQFLKELAKV